MAVTAYNLDNIASAAILEALAWNALTGVLSRITDSPFVGNLAGDPWVKEDYGKVWSGNNRGN